MTIRFQSYREWLTARRAQHRVLETTQGADSHLTLDRFVTCQLADGTRWFGQTENGPVRAQTHAGRQVQVFHVPGVHVGDNAAADLADQAALVEVQRAAMLRGHDGRLCGARV